ncbi:hypothetical protein PHPALM_29351 [Phytophthora palmivora]|uniref:Calmodulin n=1 Tax=Phytophthora palmivora TaxID=4796 RepID=A0A2P4X7S9_9STRA|nr:hypothetical protein PHPALM_29351 [Phytophthora palmivora]
MTSAFYWECDVFRLAVAPWCSDPKQQRVVSARVAVAEQRTPGFALRFDLELLEKKAEMQSVTPSRHLMRFVNQQQMLRAFEFAFVGAEAKDRQAPGGEGRDELLDMRLKKWLAGGGQVPPPRKEELVRWLLARMLVTPKTNLLKRGSSIRTSSSRSLANALQSSAFVEQKKTEIKATIVQLNPRLDSLEMAKFEESSNEWSESRRHFHKRLHESRRDIQIAKQQRDKAEKLAQLRHTQLLQESARILQENEKKRRDAQAVRQLVADTLEYRDELYAMESRMKQECIAAHRDQERVKRQTRAVLGHTEKTSRRFGPPSRKERDLLFGDNYSSTRDKSAVFDLHGRRHNLEEADQIAKDTSLESALRKIRRLLLSSAESVDIFRQYDLDRSGTLSYIEFQRMLRENGTGDSAELTRDQSIAFFKHFDADGSGEIEYAELLWRFFNWEAFLKRWYEQKSVTTAPIDNKAEQLFKKYDSTNRGMVSLQEFQIVMDHLGVTLGDVDAKLLAVKFDAGKDDYINYREFLKSVNLFESQDTATNNDHHPTTQSDQHPDTGSSGMERIWTELRELSVTQAKLQRLLQK